VARLGARAAWWDLPDAVYRQDDEGGWPYGEEPALFGRLAPVDDGLVTALAERLSGLPGVGRRTLVFAPLGVGGHVDHQLVRLAAECWRQGDLPWLYEDFPYAEDAGAAAAAVRPRVSWRAWRTRLSERHLLAKAEAAAAYGSQLSTFWPSRHAMDAALRRFAERTGGGAPAERCWRRRRGPPSAK
jgi:hypothetical protein